MSGPPSGPRFPLPLAAGPRLDPDAYRRIAGGEWWQFVGEADAARAHAENVARCKAAVAAFQAGGPVKVLVVHASGRASARSAAGEPSNSQLLLGAGLAALRESPPPEGLLVDEVSLRDYLISPCDACYSTSSACCTMPCTAFPLDGMQELYPRVLWADLLLISTPTNQAAMSSRLKLFVDRLISLDGGYFVDADQYAPMDADFRARMLALATTAEVPYDQRLHNKVAAFFVANKDDRDTGYLDDNGVMIESYVQAVAKSLYRGFYNFGFAFPEPCYVAFRAVPNEDLAFDKQRLSEATGLHRKARELVLAAVGRVREVRRTPLPPAVCPPGRT
jgi:multimeric flavodoxin WrbA